MVSDTVRQTNMQILQSINLHHLKHNGSCLYVQVYIYRLTQREGLHAYPSRKAMQFRTKFVVKGNEWPNKTTIHAPAPVLSVSY